MPWMLMGWDMGDNAPAMLHTAGQAAQNSGLNISRLCHESMMTCTMACRATVALTSWTPAPPWRNQPDEMTDA